MHILVATVVHHPQDARILHRQIRALLDAGHRVTYLAPFRDRGVTPWAELTAVDVPRAAGRRRLRALRAARRAIAEHCGDADLILFHDPELMFSLPRSRPPAIWDVHEDTAAAVLTRPWVPGWLRRPLAAVVRAAERRAERRLHLLLAEEGYRDRFRGEHPVVPNTTTVPAQPARDPGTGRVVYVGQVSKARGAEELVRLGGLLRPHGIVVDIIGGADEEVRPLLRDAQREGDVRWYGFVPNHRALRMASGALAGICLLHDIPNYRHSMPTKIVEYMAHGIPVVASPLPVSRQLVAEHRFGPGGIVVPFGDAEEATEAVLKLRADGELRTAYARTGHRIALEDFHWPVHAKEFVRQLEDWGSAAAGAGQVHGARRVLPQDSGGPIVPPSRRHTLTLGSYPRPDLDRPFLPDPHLP